MLLYTICFCLNQIHNIYIYILCFSSKYTNVINIYIYSIHCIHYNAKAMYIYIINKYHAYHIYITVCVYAHTDMSACADICYIGY